MGTRYFVSDKLSPRNAQTPSPGTPGEGKGEGQRMMCTENHDGNKNKTLTQPSPGVPGEGSERRRSLSSSGV